MRVVRFAVVAVVLATCLALLFDMNLWAFAVGLVVCVTTGALLWHTARYGYQCSECRHEFPISIFSNLAGPHVPTENGGQKLLRCPVCQKKVWADIKERSELTPNTDEGP